jgi:hypothetical protein
MRREDILKWLALCADLGVEPSADARHDPTGSLLLKPVAPRAPR